MGLVFFAALICRQPDPDGPVIRGSCSARTGWGFPPPAAGTVENRVNPKSWSLASGFSPALTGGYISGQSCPLSRWPVFRRMSTVPGSRIQERCPIHRRPIGKLRCRETHRPRVLHPAAEGFRNALPATPLPGKKLPRPEKNRRGSFQFRLKPDGYSPAFSVRKSSANWACMSAPRCSTSSGTLYFSWWLV